MSFRSKIYTQTEFTNRGEIEFHSQVSKLLQEDTALWFNINVPKAGLGKEIDCLLYSSEIKFFITIEVKGYYIQEIKEILKGKIVLSNGEQRPNPWDQASDNAKKMFTVMKFYRDNNSLLVNKKLYFSPVVCFPFIKREDFKRSFSSHTSFFKELTEYTIFRDDFNNRNTFVDKIRLCVSKPIYNNTVEDYWKPSDRTLDIIDLDKINAIICPHFTNQMNQAYTMKVIKDLEKVDLNRLLDLNKDEPVITEGFAGTGKTFIGLQHARNLALSGSKVLFTCYNKTLAVDIQRIVLNELPFRNEPEVKSNLFVKDIFKILSDLFKLFPNEDNLETSIVSKSHKPSYDPEIVDKELKDIIDQKDYDVTSYDIWALDVIERILKKEKYDTHLFKYDYIIVDEVQDFKDYMFDLLELLCISYKNIFYIYGKNQVLYLNRGIIINKSFLEIKNKIKSKANIIEKRRVYRNTDMTFLFAQSFLENYPYITEAIEWIQEKRMKQFSKRNNHDSFETVRKGGSPPKLFINNGKSNSLTDLIEKLLKEIFTRNIGQNGLDCDVMILIPNREYLKDLVVNILVNKLKKKYIDYTNDNYKRLEYSYDEVRICTFFSARGLEANYTLILGFAFYEELIRQMKKEYIVRDLGYIVLSRSKFDTFLIDIVEEGQIRNRQIRFLEELIKAFDNQ